MTTTDTAPHGAYAALMATFASALAAAALLAKALGREPEEQTALDLVVLRRSSRRASAAC
jgi:hypothetical protein